LKTKKRKFFTIPNEWITYQYVENRQYTTWRKKGGSRILYHKLGGIANLIERHSFIGCSFDSLLHRKGNSVTQWLCEKPPRPIYWISIIKFSFNLWINNCWFYGWLTENQLQVLTSPSPCESIVISDESNTLHQYI
jgi:hypothetical protein